MSWSHTKGGSEIPQAEMGLVRGVPYWLNISLNVPQSTLELRARTTCKRVLILPQKYFIICITIQNYSLCQDEFTALHRLQNVPCL